MIEPPSEAPGSGDWSGRQCMSQVPGREVVHPVDGMLGDALQYMT